MKGTRAASPSPCCWLSRATNSDSRLWTGLTGVKSERRILKEGSRWNSDPVVPGVNPCGGPAAAARPTRAIRRVTPCHPPHATPAARPYVPYGPGGAYTGSGAQQAYRRAQGLNGRVLASRPTPLLSCSYPPHPPFLSPPPLATGGTFISTRTRPRLLPLIPSLGSFI